MSQTDRTRRYRERLRSKHLVRPHIWIHEEVRDEMAAKADSMSLTLGQIVELAWESYKEQPHDK